MRSLDRRGRLVAAAIAVLLFGLFALSAGRALHDRWIPTGDEALLTLRAHDVLDGHPPLVGQPSTTRLTGSKETNHPGPIQPWLFAIPVRILGPAAGMRLSAAAINGAAVLLAVWVVLRRAGPGVALGAAAVIALVVWAQGIDVASDPLSSNQGAYPALALAFLCWALLAGDIRLAPLTALVASFTAQQHLNQVIPVVLLVLVASAGATWQVVRRRSRARERAPNGDAPPLFDDLRWVLAAGVVLVITTMPMLVQQVTGHPGNITAVIGYAGEGGRPTLGAVRGMTQVLRAAGTPSLLVHPNLTGYQAQSPLAWPAVVAGIVMLGVLVLMAVLDHRRDRAHLAVIALVVSLAGFFNGTNLLEAESGRINQYRWMWVVCALSWLAISWWIAERILPWLRRTSGSLARIAAPAGAIAVVTFLFLGDVGAFAVRSRDDVPRFENSFDLVRELRPALREETRGGGTWIVAIDGVLAYNTIAPALVLDLAEHGVDVDVSSLEVDVHQFYGGRRHRSGPVRGVLFVTSSLGPARTLPGKLVAAGRLNPELNGLLDRVAPTLIGRPVKAAPNGKAEAVLRGLGYDGFERYFALLRADQIGRDPNALRDPAVLRGMAGGMLSTPTLAQPTMRRLLRLLGAGGAPLLWGHDRVEVRRMTVRELATLGPFK